MFWHTKKFRNIFARIVYLACSLVCACSRLCSNIENKHATLKPTSIHYLRCRRSYFEVKVEENEIFPNVYARRNPQFLLLFIFPSFLRDSRAHFDKVTPMWVWIWTLYVLHWHRRALKSIDLFASAHFLCKCHDKFNWKSKWNELMFL